MAVLLRLQSPTRGCNGTILGRGTHNRYTTAANNHSSIIFVMGRMASRRIAAKPSCQIATPPRPDVDTVNIRSVNHPETSSREQSEDRRPSLERTSAAFALSLVRGEFTAKSGGWDETDFSLRR